MGCEVWWPASAILSQRCPNFADPDRSSHRRTHQTICGEALTLALKNYFKNMISFAPAFRDSVAFKEKENAR